MSGFVGEALRARNRYLLRLAVVAALGGLLFGYDTGVISGALLFIKKDLGASQAAQQWIVGSLLLGAVAGASVSGYLADRAGRRATLVAAGVVYVVGALASAFAQGVFWLVAARAVLGLAVGAASFVAPMYIAENTPARLRGGVTTFNQLMVATGILLAYIADFALKSVPGSWRWMTGIAALPGLALAIGMLFVPASPRWLVRHDRDDEARAVLRHTRDERESDEEIDEIHEAVDQAARLRVRDLFRSRLRPILSVGLALAIFQQFIGVNTVIYYSATIFTYTGLGTSTSVLRALFVGITNVVATAVAVIVLDRVGRRPLLLVGTAGCAASLAVLGVWFQVGWLKEHAPFLALVALLVFMASFAIGLGPVFWLMISEIFPLGVRSAAMSISTIANWAANFLVSYFFLQLVAGIGQAGTFWLYAGMGLVAFTFFLWRVPETKDRSLEEIEEDLGASEPAQAA